MSGDQFFDFLTDQPITLNGETHLLCLENGMTGIGSRRAWIDGKELPYFRSVRHTPDLSSGNHLLYSIKWRELDFDRVYIFIHENKVPLLLSDENSWRQPIRLHVDGSPLATALGDKK